MPAYEARVVPPLREELAQAEVLVVLEHHLRSAVEPDSASCVEPPSHTPLRRRSSIASIARRSYATFMPVSASVSPSGSGSMNALYSQKNAAQSRARSVTTFRIGPPTTAWPCSCAERAAVAHSGVTLQWSSMTATNGAVEAKIRPRAAPEPSAARRTSAALPTASPRRGGVASRRRSSRDDHLGAGCPFGERVETVADVREAVHRGDDDGQLGLGHLPRRLSR